MWCRQVAVALQPFAQGSRLSREFVPSPPTALTADATAGLEVGPGLFELGWKAIALDDRGANRDGGRLFFSGFGPGLRLPLRAATGCA